MSGKLRIKDRPPDGESYVWQTREFRSSDAWRSANIHVRRLMDFLYLEHMRHAGQENGRLKAPYDQLEDFGIGSQYIAKAIRDGEHLGLIDCHRGGLRVESAYAITSCRTHDDKPASNRWRSYRNPRLKPLSTPKRENLPYKGKAALPYKRKADGPNLPYKGKADRPKTRPYKGRVPSRSSYQDAGSYSVEEGEPSVGRTRPGEADADAA
jgi:hypothetical protein